MRSAHWQDWAVKWQSREAVQEHRNAHRRALELLPQTLAIVSADGVCGGAPEAADGVSLGISASRFRAAADIRHRR
jgi:hypothetical protein